MSKDYMYCDNLELCPKCGEFPTVFDTVWRITSLQCECGNNYGGIHKIRDGEDTGEEFCKTVYQQWQDGVRKEIGKRKLVCKFLRFEKDEYVEEYHFSKFKQQEVVR